MRYANCPLSENELTQLVAGELPDEDAREMAHHILACPRCARVLGQLMATDILVHTPAPGEASTAPSPEFWVKLSARLDEIDNVASATSSCSVAPRPRMIPQLVAAGIALVVFTFVAQQLALQHFSGVTPPQLAQIHRQAVANVISSASRSGMASVAYGAAQAPQRLGNVRMIQVGNQPALLSTYMVGGIAVSALCTRRNGINLRGWHALTGSDGRYRAAQLTDGTIMVADTGGEMWTVAMGRGPVEAMLALLTKLPRSTYDGTM